MGLLQVACVRAGTTFRVPHLQRRSWDSTHSTYIPDPTQNLGIHIDGGSHVLQHEAGVK